MGYLDSEESLLRQFSQIVYQSENPDTKADDAFTYGSWLGLFQAIGRMAQNRRLVVIIDEYPLSGWQQSAACVSIAKGVGRTAAAYTNLFGHLRFVYFCDGGGIAGA
ncbi:MAG: hypothetical protein R2911_32695 [Caldilineaceae bacterium]